MLHNFGRILLPGCKVASLQEVHCQICAHTGCARVCYSDILCSAKLSCSAVTLLLLCSAVTLCVNTCCKVAPPTKVSCVFLLKGCCVFLDAI